MGEQSFRVLDLFGEILFTHKSLFLKPEMGEQSFRVLDLFCKILFTHKSLFWGQKWVNRASGFCTFSAKSCEQSFRVLDLFGEMPRSCPGVAQELRRNGQGVAQQ